MNEINYTDLRNNLSHQIFLIFGKKKKRKDRFIQRLLNFIPKIYVHSIQLLPVSLSIFKKN